MEHARSSLPRNVHFLCAPVSVPLPRARDLQATSARISQQIPRPTRGLRTAHVTPRVRRRLHTHASPLRQQTLQRKAVKLRVLRGTLPLVIRRAQLLAIELDVDLRSSGQCMQASHLLACILLLLPPINRAPLLSIETFETSL